MFRPLLQVFCHKTKQWSTNIISGYWLTTSATYLKDYTAPDPTPSGSATIILELTAGHIVRVENDYSNIIYGTDNSGTIRSWFTGHMLYEL